VNRIATELRNAALVANYQGVFGVTTTKSVQMKAQPLVSILILALQIHQMNPAVDSTEAPLLVECFW